MSSSDKATTRARSIGQRGQRPRGHSRFKGVTLHVASGRWMARAMVMGERRSLGYFDDEDEAARAYDRAVYADHRGARGNFPIREYEDLVAEHDRRRAEENRRYARLGGSALPASASEVARHLDRTV